MSNKYTKFNDIVNTPEYKELRERLNRSRVVDHLSGLELEVFVCFRERFKKRLLNENYQGTPAQSAKTFEEVAANFGMTEHMVRNILYKVTNRFVG